MAIFDLWMRVRRAATPAKKVWRISRSRDVWEFVPWEFSDNHHFNGRWDDPEGAFRVLYAGDSVYGCALETLANFRVDPHLLSELAELETDPRDTPSLPPGKIPFEWRTERYIGQAKVAGKFYDPNTSTNLAVLRAGLGLDLDVSTLKSAHARATTQKIASYVYRVLGLDGIDYASRHGEEERLIAVFEKVGVSIRQDQRITPLSSGQTLFHIPKGVSDAMETFGLQWETPDFDASPAPAIEPWPSEEMDRVAYPPDGVPRKNQPLGAARLWTDALENGDLEEAKRLTWSEDGWGDDFASAIAAIEGLNFKSGIDWPADEIGHGGSIAYVGMVDASPGRVQFGGLLDKVVWLTMVKCSNGEWRVWGLGGRTAPPEDVYQS